MSSIYGPDNAPIVLIRYSYPSLVEKIENMKDDYKLLFPSIITMKEFIDEII